MITLILGLMNSGKTLYMTRELFKAYKKGKTVITNYPVNFSHHLVNKDWFLNLAKKETIIDDKNLVMGLDESWIWFDSRKSQANANIFGSYVFLQSSKTDTEIYLTAQHIGQFDVRIRDNCHNILQCARVIKKNKKFYTLSEEKRFLPSVYQDNLYIKATVFKKVTLGFYPQLQKQKIVYIKAKPIFELFDTTKKIKTDLEVKK